MDDEITYGVFYKGKDDCSEWKLFSGWFKNYDESQKELESVFNNSRWYSAKIVERVETFSTVPGTLKVVER